MTDSATAIPLGPFVEAFAPYVAYGVVIAVGAGVTLALRTWNRWIGRKDDEVQMEAIRQEAKTEAGAMVAAASDNLAGRSVLVTDPKVAAAAMQVAAALPGAIKATGMTPDRLGRLVAGEVGKLQAQATAQPVAQTPTTELKKL